MAKSSSSSASLPYIPHLDGLRAVALLLVLVFHFDPAVLPGGFLGVDVFLTLSGYLITSTILHSHLHNSFSLPFFFRSRFLRLYPTSALIILLTMLSAYLLLPPDATLDLSKAALSALGVGANLYAHFDTSYFDHDASLKPLLHLWSLSLEEQFYFIFAPILFFFLSRNRSPHLFLLVLMPLSFALACLLHPLHPSFVFYQLPTRLYQFCAGALLALSTRKPTFLSFLSYFAIPLLFLSAILVPSSPHPLYTLPTLLATLLLLPLPASHPLASLLSLRPLRALGRVSYVAYLLHWPLQCFVRHLTLAFGFSQPSTILLLPLTVLLSQPIHLYFEQPNRKPKRLQFLLILLPTILFAFWLSLLALLSSGFSFRLSAVSSPHNNPVRKVMLPNILPYVQHSAQKKYKILQNSGITHATSGASRSGIDSNVMLFGNSYAGHWRWALADIGKRHRNVFHIFLRNGCGLFPMKYAKRFPRRCRQSSEVMWQLLHHNVSRGTVIGMSTSWWGIPELVLSELLAELFSELRQLGMKPFLLGETPGLSGEADRFFACKMLAWTPFNRIWSRVRGLEDDVAWAYDCVPGLKTRGFTPYPGRLARYRQFRRICQRHEVPLLDLFHELCGKIDEDIDERQVLCRMPANRPYAVGAIGYLDDRHHLTPFGSACLSGFVERFFVQIGALNHTAATPPFGEGAEGT